MELNPLAISLICLLAIPLEACVLSHFCVTLALALLTESITHLYNCDAAWPTLIIGSAN